MFEIGFSELLLTAVVALLVLGPEKLPGAARTLGGMVRRLRAQWTNLQYELEQELHTQELKQHILNPLRESEIQSQLNETFADLRRSTQDAAKVFNQGLAPQFDPPSTVQNHTAGDAAGSDTLIQEAPEVATQTATNQATTDSTEVSSESESSPRVQDPGPSR